MTATRMYIHKPYTHVRPAPSPAPPESRPTRRVDQPESLRPQDGVSIHEAHDDSTRRFVLLESGSYVRRRLLQHRLQLGEKGRGGGDGEGEGRAFRGSSPHGSACGVLAACHVGEGSGEALDEDGHRQEKAKEVSCHFVGQVNIVSFPYPIVWEQDYKLQGRCLGY